MHILHGQAAGLQAEVVVGAVDIAAAHPDMAAAVKIQTVTVVVPVIFNVEVGCPNEIAIQKRRGIAVNNAAAANCDIFGILGKQEAAVQLRLVAVAVVVGIGAIVGNIRAGQQGGAVGDFQRHIAFQVQRTADKCTACQPHRAALRGGSIYRRLHGSRVFPVAVSHSPVAAGIETILHLAFLRQMLLLFPAPLCRDGSHTVPSG